MADVDDDLDLTTLDDDELVQQMHEDLYDGLADEIVEGTNILLERGWMPYKVLTEALVEGMRIVGIDFRDGILFVPEVLLAANSMKAGMAILRPLLAETGAPKLGSIVIGTVKGDIHDIGKNLVGMMLEGAGFDVFDIGINNDADSYLTALDEHRPDFLGMSALLTTTMPYMKVVIDTFEGTRTAQRLHGAGGRCTAERGLRQERRRRRLLPRRGGCRGNRQGHGRRTPPAGRGCGLSANAHGRSLVIACGALAHDIMTLVRVHGWDAIEVQCLPADWHNRPSLIPGGVRRKIREARGAFENIFVAYADCGTGGAPRRGAGRGGRVADRRAPLLPVLRRQGCLRGSPTTRSRAPSISPTTWYAISTR